MTIHNTMGHLSGAGGPLTTTNFETVGNAGLRPWREVVVPYPDLTSGSFQCAEFAADLWQVPLGEGPHEYKDGVEFFRRTFLTQSLQALLESALRRLTGAGGDAVLELRADYGAGKTHSLIALWHLFSGVPVEQMPGIEDVTRAVGIRPPLVNRAVLVGNRIPLGDFQRKPDGTSVRTLWGELAWQIGGREGYELLRCADEQSADPGDSLLALLNQYSPCLILIDEWVAYAQQANERSDNASIFAEILSQAARRTAKTLVVVSIPALNDLLLPASKRRSSREADLAARPASHPMTPAQEAFEIVCGRLFQPIEEPHCTVARDAVVTAFAEHYSSFPDQFPHEASNPGYRSRISATYPIHPELLERLYRDWSLLDDFHRIRGILRLMSAVIHSLWKSGNQDLMILPGSVPVDDDAVRGELSRYLPPAWNDVVFHDSDEAVRRVARALYLGSTPDPGGKPAGMGEREIHLGCVQPGEASALYTRALHRMTEWETNFLNEEARYWFSPVAESTRKR